MKVLDLFSGIGGFHLGLERAGMKTVAFCEIDEFCQKILKKHWPDVAIHKDIKQLDGKQYAGTIDVVCGGYPCQPFSVAGKQKGKADKRHLWPEMFRIISEARPTWIICENVRGHLNKGLDAVLTDLEGIGYTTRSYCISAKSFGANSGRERIWIVANSSSYGCNESKVTRGDAKTNEYRQKRKKKTINNERCGSLRALLEGGYSPWKWGVESPPYRVDDGLSNRAHRLRALGNAVIPQIPEIIGKYIMKVEEHENNTM